MTAQNTPPASSPSVLRRGRLLGKYRLIHRVGEGGYADVWRAQDTIEGIPVALKMPRRLLADSAAIIADFRREARILAQLDHPHILRLKNADIIENRIVLAYELGKEDLEMRLRRRYRTEWALKVVHQLLEALSGAHEKKIIHRDVKPENVFLFEDDKVRLGDFCIAHLADAKLTGETSSGTLGYMAPEQAYGRPGFSSDVFSVGLILYRLLSGQLPNWPFAWPYPGLENLSRKVPPAMISVIKKATAFHPRSRYFNATRMLTAYRYALAKFRRFENDPVKKVRREKRVSQTASRKWEDMRVREFEKTFHNRYGLRFECRKCGHPIGEEMSYCPWCGTGDNSCRETTTYPAFCPECERGVRMEWKHCPWCYAGRFADAVPRPHKDKRYTEKCANPECADRRMMPFMRYCPACKTKAKRPPKCTAGEKPCPHCRWPVASGFWRNCAWCGKKVT
ncbi:MAG: serine/threonine-protein kinase [bacterium]|nr:serine/threonine-protein kinase [bacterium]